MLKNNLERKKKESELLITNSTHLNQNGGNIELMRWRMILLVDQSQFFFQESVASFRGWQFLEYRFWRREWIVWIVPLEELFEQFLIYRLIRSESQWNKTRGDMRVSIICGDTRFECLRQATSRSNHIQDNFCEFTTLKTLKYSICLLWFIQNQKLNWDFTVSLSFREKNWVETV